MTRLPADLASHVGQDVRLRDVFRAARRARRHAGSRIVGLYVLMGLAMFGVSYIVVRGYLWLAEHLAPDIDWWQGLLVFLALLGLLLVLYALLWWPMGAGVAWSAVCRFDGRRPKFGDLVFGFRAAWGRLTLLGLLDGLAYCLGSLLPVLAVMLLAFQSTMGSMAGGGGGPPQVVLMILMFGSLAVGGVIAPLVIRPLLLLVPQFALSGRQVRARDALRLNWRALRGQFWRMVLVAALPVSLSIAMLLLMFVMRYVASYLMTKALSVSGAMPSFLWFEIMQYATLGVQAVAWLVFMWWYVFIKAALFRSVYGYTLEVQPVGEAAAPAAAVSVANA